MTETWEGKRVMIRDDWFGGGRKGIALSEPVFVEQDWVPVKMDNEEDPTFHKEAGLIIIPHEPVDAWAVLHAIHVQATRKERATDEYSYLVFDLDQIARLSKNALATLPTEKPE